MKLSDVDFSKLKIGDTVISAVNTSGKIVKLIDIQHALHQEDNEIAIAWANGSYSEIWHCWCKNITYVGCNTLG